MCAYLTFKTVQIVQIWLLNEINSNKLIKFDIYL